MGHQELSEKVRKQRKAAEIYQPKSLRWVVAGTLGVGMRCGKESTKFAVDNTRGIPPCVGSCRDCGKAASVTCLKKNVPAQIRQVFG